jgi:hypothetical protein
MIHDRNNILELRIGIGYETRSQPMAFGNQIIVDIRQYEDDKNTLKEMLHQKQPVQIKFMLYAEDADPPINRPAEQVFRQLGNLPALYQLAEIAYFFYLLPEMLAVFQKIIRKEQNRHPSFLLK